MAVRHASPSPLPFRTAAVTTEQVVCAKPCWVYGLTPELTTTGTITLRNTPTAAGGAVAHLCAIGLTQAGKVFGGGQGVLFDAGLTIHLSVATDLTMITYEPAT